MKIVVLCGCLVACVVGSDVPDRDDVPPSGNDGGAIPARISTDTTFAGSSTIAVATTIDPGVTVTVTAGATLEFAAGASLAIDGTLDIQGTATSLVTIKGAGTSLFGGLAVNTGGTLTLNYVVETGGSIYTSGGSTTTIVDSLLYGASGDLVVMNGGTLAMTHSQVGAPPGVADTTHCNLHLGGAGNAITITHTNIVGQPYGLMFYGGTGATFANNNWTCGITGCTDHVDVDSQPGVSGDFSNGYFEKAPPVGVAGATITANGLAATPLADAGVRWLGTERSLCVPRAAGR